MIQLILLDFKLCFADQVITVVDSDLVMRLIHHGPWNMYLRISHLDKEKSFFRHPSVDFIVLIILLLIHLLL